jgi:hypothetical protein
MSFAASSRPFPNSDELCVTTYPRGSSLRVFVIRLPSRSLGEGWSFVIRLSSIVVSELPKTATGKLQKYVLRGKPAISKQ